MMKGNTFSRLTPLLQWFFCCLLLLASNGAWAQATTSHTPGDTPGAALDNTYMVILHAHSVIDTQLSGAAGDPVQAVHNLAHQISREYGGAVARELVSEQYGFILRDLSREQVTRLAGDTRVQSVTVLNGSVAQQRSALSVSVSCSYSGLGSLYECQATVSGGIPPYRYDWEAANSTATSFGSIAYIDSCAAVFFESYRLTVTDSASNEDTITGSVPCTGGF